MKIGITPVPVDVIGIAKRLMQAAMALDEDSNNCAGNPIPENFDDMMTSMANMKETLIQAFAEIQVG